MYHSITAAVVVLLLGFAILQGMEGASVFGSDVISDVRLVGGPNRCEGRLEIRPSANDQFGQACDSDVTTREANVICRQLNCGEAGRLADANDYGFSSVDVFRGFGYVCQGNEGVISNCQRTGSRCSASRADNAVSIQCSSNSGISTLLGVNWVFLLVISVVFIFFKV